MTDSCLSRLNHEPDSGLRRKFGRELCPKYDATLNPRYISSARIQAEVQDRKFPLSVFLRMKMISPSSQRFLLALFILVLLGLPSFSYLSHQPINHDTAWFMYAALGMRNGGILYRDFFDVNAPMAYLTMMPAAWLVQTFGVANETALTSNVFAFIVPAYAFIAAILARLPLSLVFYCFFLVCIFLTLSIMPGYAFGQREHLFAILSLPYIFAAALRTEKSRPFPLLAFCAGFAAGLGASIKIPFVLVIATVEVARLIRQRGKISVTGDLAGALVALFLLFLFSFEAYPVYWTKIVPEVLPLYGPYNNLDFLVDALSLLFPLLFLGLLAINWNRGEEIAAVRNSLLVALLAVFLLFIMQQKGWPHQALPILTFLAVLFLFNLTDFQRSLGSVTKGALVRGGLNLIGLIITFYLAFTPGRVDPAMMADIEREVKSTNGSYYIMSTGNYPAFPLALEKGAHWASRFPQLLLLPGLIEQEELGTMSSWEPWFREAVLDDIERNKPSLVFVFLGQDPGMPAEMDTLSWFRRDKDFEQEWSHYAPYKRLPSFAVFMRKDLAQSPFN